MAEPLLKLTGSPKDFETISSEEEKEPEKTIVTQPVTITGSVKPEVSPIQTSAAPGKSNEAKTPPLPDFISKNRLREIVEADPRLKASKEARRFLVKSLLSRGKEIEGLNARFEPIEALKNIPESAKELGMSFVHLFTTNPLTTVKGLSSVALGALEKTVPGAQSHEEAFNALADAMVERYGSYDKVLNTIEKDPVGFAGDLASVVTGAGGALKGAVTLGAKASLVGARGASALARTAEVLKRTGNIIDPINVAARAGLKTASVLEGQPALKTIKKVNDVLGINKLIKKTDVNETMMEGLGLSSGEKAKMYEKLGTERYGEDLAKLGVTGTLPEMSARLGEIGQKTKQVYDKTLEDLSKATRPKTRTPPEIEADVVKRTEQLDQQGLSLETDPTLQKLEKELNAAYSQNLRPPKVNTLKVQSADKALDQLHTLYGGSKVDFADLLKGESEQVLKNLGLTSGETYQVANKTLTENIGKRLSDIGIDPDDTPRNVVKKLDESAAQSKNAVDTALAKVPTRYSTKVADKILNNLSDIRSSLPFTRMSKRLQEEHNRIVQLLVKNENKGLTLSELNETKRLLDDMAGSKVFTKTGDVKTSNIGQNLGDLRKELRHLIEVQGKKAGVENIRDLNNNTQFAQELKRVLEKKIKSGTMEPEPPATGKFTSVEFENLRQQFKDLRAKNKEQGLTMAELGKIDDAVVGALKSGVGKPDRMNLEALQKNIREVMELNARKQGVTNLKALREQQNFAGTFKSLIEHKIARGGDKVVKSKLLSEHMNAIIHQAVINQSKLGRLTALTRAFFQISRSPQFRRDLATAVQLLKDKDFKKLEGGIKYSRTPTALEQKFGRRQARYQANEDALRKIDEVVRNLSRAYPALRGLRITSEALQTQETE